MSRIGYIFGTMFTGFAECAVLFWFFAPYISDGFEIAAAVCDYLAERQFFSTAREVCR